MKPDKKIDREIKALHGTRKSHGVRGKQRKRKHANMKPSKKLDREIKALYGTRKSHKIRGNAHKVDLAQRARPPTSTSDIRSPTSTSTEVRSPTSTSTEVRSPTSTSTDAYTSGNVTVTGGAGRGATTSVKIYTSPKSDKEARRADSKSNEYRSRGSQNRMTDMIEATMAPRAPAPMPAIMSATDDRKHRGKRLRSDAQLDAEIAETLAKKNREGRPRDSMILTKSVTTPRGTAPRGTTPRAHTEPFDRPSSKKESRLTYGKTTAQLDAEIAEALAGRTSREGHPRDSMTLTKAVTTPRGTRPRARTEPSGMPRAWRSPRS
jgi:hypothetical protein